MHAARVVVRQHFNAKHKGCIVRVKARAQRQEGNKVAWSTWVAEAQKDSKKKTIQCLVDQNVWTLNEPEQIYAAFLQNFAELFVGNSRLDNRMDFLANLDCSTGHSAREAECKKSWWQLRKDETR